MRKYIKLASDVIVGASELGDSYDDYLKGLAVICDMVSNVRSLAESCRPDSKDAPEQNGEG